MAACKISLQKSKAFLYTNNKHLEKEITDTLLFSIASKNIKYLRINLSKQVQDLCNELYQTMPTPSPRIFFNQFTRRLTSFSRTSCDHGKNKVGASWRGSWLRDTALSQCVAGSRFYPQQH